MKTLNFLKKGIIILYLIGLMASVFYAVLNPTGILKFFKTGSAETYCVVSAVFLISAWILFGVILIGMVIEKEKQARKKRGD